VPNATHTDVDWLRSTEDVFAWLNMRRPVRWHRGELFVTQAQFRSGLSQTADQFAAIEQYPHEPMIPRHYYLCSEPVPGGGDALRQFLDFFQPATPIDRDLMQAAMMTMLWGGPGGKRPVFLVTSTGRGCGKTMAVQYMAAVFGGAIEFSVSETGPAAKERLLSTDGLQKRVAMLDNIKTHKMSSGDFEGLITAPTISGRRMYVGDAERPNMLTWCLTVNGASLSKDMAQRVVTIRLKRPAYNGDWDAAVLAFVTQNRQRIIADLVGAMRGDRHPLARYTRWGMWEREILERLPEPADAQQVIQERQAEIDSDTDEANGIVETFTHKLADLGYNVDSDRVLIPSAVCVQWLSESTGRPYNATSGSRHLQQLIEEGDFPKLRKNPTRQFGRGFVWEGGQAVDNPIRRDLDERIRRNNRSW